MLRRPRLTVARVRPVQQGFAFAAAKGVRVFGKRVGSARLGRRPGAAVWGDRVKVSCGVGAIDKAHAVAFGADAQNNTGHVDFHVAFLILVEHNNALVLVFRENRRAVRSPRQVLRFATVNDKGCHAVDEAREHAGRVIVELLLASRRRQNQVSFRAVGREPEERRFVSSVERIREQESSRSNPEIVADRVGTDS